MALHLLAASRLSLHADPEPPLLQAAAARAAMAPRLGVPLGGNQRVFALPPRLPAPRSDETILKPASGLPVACRDSQFIADAEPDDAVIHSSGTVAAAAMAPPRLQAAFGDAQPIPDDAPPALVVPFNHAAAAAAAGPPPGLAYQDSEAPFGRRKRGGVRERQRQQNIQRRDAEVRWAWRPAPVQFPSYVWFCPVRRCSHAGMVHRCLTRSCSAMSFCTANACGAPSNPGKCQLLRNDDASCHITRMDDCILSHEQLHCPQAARRHEGAGQGRRVQAPAPAAAPAP